MLRKPTRDEGPAPHEAAALPPARARARGCACLAPVGWVPFLPLRACRPPRHLGIRAWRCPPASLGSLHSVLSGESFQPGHFTLAALFAFHW